VGFAGFSTKSKNQQTPLQSCGTRLHAFFAVRNQHTVQVKPVEGVSSQNDRRHMITALQRNAVTVFERKK
jgi:hypothetical protein